LQPLAGRRVHLGQIGEGAQRPEVLAHITDWPVRLCLSPRPPPRDRRAE
jgi:hypothetical protein